jgi:kynureninase
MPPLLADLARRPNALAPAYTRFRVADRLLLSGHSHQAWPDCAFAAQQQAWLDAAEFVDAKWERAFAQADRVRAGYAMLLGDEPANIALGQNTHELVVRLLSALPLARRPRLLTTDGEFHSIRRQLDRLAEEALEVVKITARPHDTLAARLAAAVDDRTALVLVSSVQFGTGLIVPGLREVAAACERHGAELLVDAYHQLGVVPCDLQSAGLQRAFVTGGGYKYCQLGEGNGFLRVPPGCALRPAITGWFAEFDARATAHGDGSVAYGPGVARFGGATYDPTSHYRAAAVFAFFAERGLTAAFLREVSQHQIGVLAAAFDALAADPALIRRDTGLQLADVGGFLVLESPRAGEFCRALADRGVLTDHRGTALRFGPAPYLDDGQLRDAIGVLGELVAAMAG